MKLFDAQIVTSLLFTFFSSAIYITRRPMLHCCVFFRHSRFRKNNRNLRIFNKNIEERLQDWRTGSTAKSHTKLIQRISEFTTCKDDSPLQEELLSRKEMLQNKSNTKLSRDNNYIPLNRRRGKKKNKKPPTPNQKTSLYKKLGKSNLAKYFKCSITQSLSV